jgi:hypothetical protein
MEGWTVCRLTQRVCHDTARPFVDPTPEGRAGTGCGGLLSQFAQSFFDCNQPIFPSLWRELPGRAAMRPMKIEHLYCCGGLALSLIAAPLAGQTIPSLALTPQAAVQAAAPFSAPARSGLAAAAPVPQAIPHAVEELRSFRASDVKFDLGDLMETLRDRRHEGWVLAAYPDPKTAQPLIGAGVTLDLPERDHPQTDPMNPHGFIEPSSAELWQAAGLDPKRLDTILAEYNHRLAAWSKKGFRRKIATLTPQITDEDAAQLLRVSAIQAIYNAKGYCRDFDRLTASQQMALSQLVYQMGVNLAEFSQFLELINHYAESQASRESGTGNENGSDSRSDAAAIALGTAQLARSAFLSEAEYWKAVQKSLVESQWARLYRMRAVSVIAMLDPLYGSAPGVAEQRVGAMLRPAAVHRRSAAHVVAAGHARRRSAGRGTRSPQQKKRRV